MGIGKRKRSKRMKWLKINTTNAGLKTMDCHQTNEKAKSSTQANSIA